MRILAPLACAASLAACTTAMDGGAPSADAASGGARASLADAAGAAKAEARIEAAGGGLRVDVSAQGMAPGVYAVHFHMVGRCDAPDFTTAGSHWNPTGRQHGVNNPQGSHLGDLPNMTVGADGTGRLQATVDSAALKGGANALLDADGAAIIIHASPDDYRTDPSGNAGKRLACGVVTAA